MRFPFFFGRKPPLWGVATTALEPTALLLSFTAFYLDQGAGEIFLFLEKTDPEFERVVAGDDRVKIIHTDEAYWQNKKGGRPELIITRQRQNLKQALRQTRCTWMLHADLDEYLMDAAAVTEHLQNLPKGVDVLSVPNAERVFEQDKPVSTVFDGVFRLPFLRSGEDRPQEVRDQLRQVYGTDAYYLPRGTTGYAGFKSFFRVAAKLHPGVHQPLPRKDWVSNPARVFHEGSYLLHFDSFTKDHWVDKLLRKEARFRRAEDDPDNFSMQKSRRRLIGALLAVPEAERAETAAELFADVQSLNAAQVAALSDQGKLVVADICPDACIRKLWPDLQVDLSPGHIDAALQELRRA